MRWGWAKYLFTFMAVLAWYAVVGNVIFHEWNQAALHSASAFIFTFWAIHWWLRWVLGSDDPYSGVKKEK